MKNIIKTINFNNLKNNILFLKSKCTKICAVVKADAYGHGIKNIVPFLDEYVPMFAVNNINEAKTARKFTKKPILVLCGFEYKDIDYACTHNFHLVVFCKKQADNIQKYVLKHNKNVCFHLKLDTGMNRLGFKTVDEIKQIQETIKKEPRMKLCGILTHFGGGNNKRINIQKQRFETFLDFFPKNTLTHSKSSMYANFKTKPNEMLRTGLSLYGYGHKNLKPILKIQAKVLFVGFAQKGEYIGYGTNFLAKHNTRYAVLAIGYADGLVRSYAKHGYALFQGQKAKICGNVCMNMTIVDIKNLNVKPGDYATILDENLNAETIAKASNTISYEILTNFR